MLVVALLFPFKNQAGDHEIAALNEASIAAPALERGAQVYREHCTSCHGPQALGDPAKVTPALAGQREMYLLKELVGFTDLQREAPEMHRLMARKALEYPRTWRDLAAYLSQLPASKTPQTGDGLSLEKGKRVYDRACIGCHGRYGEGKATGAVPALRGQHYSYLFLQLRAFASAHRLDMELPTLEYIEDLSIDELQSVADYASRMPPE